MYQAYGFVLLLNLIELIAMSVVYLVVFDVLNELCLEFEDVPPEAEILQFESVGECKYNLRLIVIGVMVTTSLVYFPLKFHFFLVLRAYWKRKRDQNEMIAL